MSLDPGYPFCEIQDMADKIARGARAKHGLANREKTVFIPFPVFDDVRHRLVKWVDALEAGEDVVGVIQLIAGTRGKLLGVRGSMRHQRLAEFLQHSIVAAEHGQTENARYILLTAMAAFGWSAEGPQP